jgi:hypothetical protein
MVCLEIDFKFKNLEEEFQRMHPRLRALVFELAYLVKTKFNRGLLVTHIERTQKEQDQLHQEKIDQGFFVLLGNKKLYSEDKLKPTLSLHQSVPSRAIDLRSHTFLDNEIAEMKEYIDSWFPYGEGKPTFLCHKNNGEHIHLQVPAIIGHRL